MYSHHSKLNLPPNVERVDYFYSNVTRQNVTVYILIIDPPEKSAYSEMCPLHYMRLFTWIARSGVESLTKHRPRSISTSGSLLSISSA